MWFFFRRARYAQGLFLMSVTAVASYSGCSTVLWVLGFVALAQSRHRVSHKLTVIFIFSDYIPIYIVTFDFTNLKVLFIEITSSLQLIQLRGCLLLSLSSLFLSWALAPSHFPLGLRGYIPYSYRRHRMGRCLG